MLLPPKRYSSLWWVVNPNESRLVGSAQSCQWRQSLVLKL
jgi:hypothetical protein